MTPKLKILTALTEYVGDKWTNEVEYHIGEIRDKLDTIGYLQTLKVTWIASASHVHCIIEWIEPLEPPL